MARHYVYAREDGGRRRLALLDGPFETLDEAHAAVEAASNWLAAREPRAWWYEYGAVTYHDDAQAIPAALMRRDRPAPEPPARRRQVVAYEHRLTEFARLTAERVAEGVGA